MNHWPKGPEKPIWRSHLWVIVTVSLLIVLAVQSLVWPQHQEVLDYHLLRKEIENGTVSDLKIGPSDITGKWQKAPETVVSFATPRRGLENDPTLQFDLKKYGIAYRGETDSSGIEGMVMYLVATGLLMGLFLLMMRRMVGGSAMAFARSRPRTYGQEDVEVTFDDVAGIDEAVDELREVVEFLKTPEKYQALGGRIPKGVLLVGPPGTGKTLLARAVAGEAGVPFFSLSGSDFVEMFVGVGAARVRDLFQQAEQKAPSIVFIDELDAMGKTRGSAPVGGHDEREQTLNQLLSEMDGFESDRGVIIMGATNRPETLDPALLRPGRFDRHVVVDRPDINGREAILRVHARSVKLGPDVDLRAIAALTPGFVGADLASLVNESALLAARSGHSSVTRGSMENGIERVVAGLEKRRRVMLPEEKRRVAVHEAGHALVAALLPDTDPVHKVSIIPRGVAALGYTLQRPQDDRYLATRSRLESEIQVLLGGIAAEELLLGECSSGATSDLERATSLARRMVKCYGMSPRIGRVSYEQSGPLFLANSEATATHTPYSQQTAREIDEEIKRIIEEAGTKTRSLIAEHRPALDAITHRLLAQEVIDGSELREIIRMASSAGSTTPPTISLDPNHQAAEQLNC